MTLVLVAATAFAQHAPGFDPSAIDRSANACVDFYQYACGNWIAANPIPPDQSRWGRFDALQERNREILRQIVEKDSAASPTRAALDQKIGDFYAACMDEAAINARGIAPLKPMLDRIAGIKDRDGVTEVMAELYRKGITPFFRFGPSPDAKNSSQMIADLDQGGLGLPDRDYYSKTDEKSVELRKQYVAHVQKMFELIGVAPADAERRAQAVMAIETELAKGSLDRVARRDPTKLYHIMMLRAVESSSPSFGWAKFFAGIDGPKIERMNVDVPDFLKSIDAVLAKTSVDDLKAYLTWNLVHNTSEVLARRRSRRRPSTFSARLCKAPKEMRPRWKRCVDQTDGQLPDALGRRARETTRWARRVCGARSTMVGEIEKAMAERSRNRYDWMTPKDETTGRAEAARRVLNCKIGAMEKVADLRYRDHRAATTPLATRSGHEPIPSTPRPREDRQARRQERVGDEPADGECLL